MKALITVGVLAMAARAIWAASPVTQCEDYRQGKKDGLAHARAARLLVVVMPAGCGCCSPYPGCIDDMPALIVELWQGLGGRVDEDPADNDPRPQRGLPLTASKGCLAAPFTPVRAARESRGQPTSLIGRSADYAQGYVEGIAAR